MHAAARCVGPTQRGPFGHADQPWRDTSGWPADCGRGGRCDRDRGGHRGRGERGNDQPGARDHRDRAAYRQRRLATGPVTRTRKGGNDGWIGPCRDIRLATRAGVDRFPDRRRRSHRGDRGDRLPAATGRHWLGRSGGAAARRRSAHPSAGEAWAERYGADPRDIEAVQQFASRARAHGDGRRQRAPGNHDPRHRGGRSPPRSRRSCRVATTPAAARPAIAAAAAR